MQREISIFDIMLDKIEPHPQNPRKDLGDLSELVQSIEANGIMQNLTVVPLDEDNKRFRCVIGHRRLAAAKKAGLVTVPCSIAWNMDEKEQVATMIAENMQRADLTIPEQVGAVRLMLDLGEDIDSVSERTGLAKATVKQRAKIAKLTDNETLTKAWANGVTLLQIEQIAKIKDPQRRAELWKKSTDKYFDREINAALYEERREKFEKRIIKLLEDAGIRKIEDGEELDKRWIQNIGEYNAPNTAEECRNFCNMPGNAKYCYTIGYGTFSIYVYYDDGTKLEEETHVDEMTLWRRRVTMTEGAFKSRELDFIVETAKKEESQFRRTIGFYIDVVLDEMEKEQRIWLNSDVRSAFKESTQIGKMWILATDTVRVSSITDYNGKIIEDRAKTARKLIDMLKEEGYEPTELEIKFFDGSHPVWNEKPEKNGQE